MKKLLLLSALFLQIAKADAQDIPSYSADALMARVTTNDTIYIINFWATWCVPCVKELPEFNKLTERYQGKPVKVLLVSLDFKDSYPAKLQAYVAKKKLLPDVVWFNETNANKFIPKIDDRWSGAIPATLIIDSKNNRRHFIEDSITDEQIADWIGDDF